MNKTLKTLYYVVLAIVVLVALTLVVSIFPVPGNIKVLTVLSGSMEPAISTGSVVVIKPTSNYDAGDVVTFDSGDDIPTTHRIVSEQSGENGVTYTTKGDANESADTEEVQENDILGKVYVDVPFMGYLLAFVQEPMGLMLLVVVPGVIIVYEEIKKLAREAKKMRQKDHE